MNAHNKRENIKAEVARGKECLKAADVLLAQSLYADAISRAYYAAFHFATALLLTRGIEVKSHAGLLNRFSLYFIKSRVFDAKFGRMLSKVQKYREESDYSSLFVFTQEDAEQCLGEVKTFTNAAKTYLKKRRY